MKSLIAVDAAEYNAATDRVNSALQVLRDEMKSLRHQDVTLMRQFISMNDAIRSISKDNSKDNKTEKRRAKRMRNRSINISASLNSTTPSWSIPLVRQQSVPRYCDVIPEVRERTWSVSSDDDSQSDSLSSSLSSLNEDSCESDSSMTSEVPVFRPSALTRQRSRSAKVDCTRSETRDNAYKVESILNSNVKLWKHAQAQSQDGRSDSDSVFEEDSEGETVST